MDPYSNNAEDLSSTGPLLLAGFLTKAFEEKNAKKFSQSYNQIVQQLSQPMNAVAIRRWLLALQQCVGSITKECHEFVMVMLRISWVEQPEIADIYVDLLENLLSATAYFAPACYEMIANHFLAPLSSIAVTRLHVLLRSLVNIVPTSKVELARILVSNFPHKRQDVQIHVSYLSNLLRVLKILPELFQDIYSVIIDRMIQIDVEIQSDPEDLPTDSEQDLMFDVELDEHSPAKQEKLHTKLMMEKLDAMMTMMLEDFDTIKHGIQPAELSNIFNFLMVQFEKIILPTHQSRYTQYLLFYFASLYPDFPDQFISFLIHILVDPQKPSNCRQAATAYIGCFISRSKSVSLNSIKQCLVLLSRWLHAYIDHSEMQRINVVPDPFAYTLFYFVSQTMFYILCFRHNQLFSIPGGEEFVRQLGFDRIISSQFNPLKICLPTVVQEFAKITEQYEIVYCYSTMEKNKRLILPHSVTGVPNPLEFFFVFEPYGLLKSHSYIDPLYQTWEDSQSAPQPGDLVSNGHITNSMKIHDQPQSHGHRHRTRYSSTSRDDGRESSSVEIEGSSFADSFISPESMTQDFAFHFRTSVYSESH